jgi:hypothetical protein
MDKYDKYIDLKIKEIANLASDFIITEKWLRERIDENDREKTLFALSSVCINYFKDY